MRMKEHMPGVFPDHLVEFINTVWRLWQKYTVLCFNVLIVKNIDIYSNQKQVYFQNISGGVGKKSNSVAVLVLYCILLHFSWIIEVWKNKAASYRWEDEGREGTCLDSRPHRKYSQQLFCFPLILGPPQKNDYMQYSGTFSWSVDIRGDDEVTVHTNNAANK